MRSAPMMLHALATVCDEVNRTVHTSQEARVCDEPEQKW